MKYGVKSLSRNTFHVVNELGHPIYDGERDGKDKPVLFTDFDAAHDCAERLNLEEQETEET